MVDEALRILFVHNGASRFVRLDLDALRRRFPVTEYGLDGHRVDPRDVWRQVGAHDLVFGWFASWHTFFPVMFASLQSKPSVLVAGGYDTACLPAIGYGHQRGGVKRWVASRTMRSATHVITNSCFTQGEAITHAGLPEDRVHVAYHGVPDPFGAPPAGNRERMALTVGNVDHPNLWRKGHLPFVQAAAHLPDTRFVLVGKWQDDAIGELRRVASTNVTFAGRVSDEELLRYYSRAAAYVQASAHEGFGMSVAEAMLAGCIPVVTRVGALPEVVGECGVYARSQQPEDVAQAVGEALALPEGVGARARSRVLESFPMSAREQALIEWVQAAADRRQPKPAGVLRRQPMR